MLHLHLPKLQLGLIHHHAAHPVFEEDGLTDQIDRTQAPHRGKAQIARLLGMRHHDADFIHVGAEHHLLCPRRPLFACNQVAHHVIGDFVDIRGNLPFNELCQLLFVSTDRKGLHHFPEEFHSFHLS